MRNRLRALIGAALAAAVIAVPALPAAAITGGQPDGEGHPNVGLILFYDATGRYRCSATLVTPTVLVTAAHCTQGTLGKTLVDFRSVVAEQAPSGYPVAADTTAGFTAAEIKAAGFVSGTASTHPQYSDFTDVRNWNDVGVVVLDEPVTDRGLSQLASRNALRSYSQPVLNKTLFTLVGYGTEVRKPDAGPQKPQPMSYPLIRRVTTSPGQKLTSQIVQMNGNPADTRGGGGTCFGDSGGPAFLNGELVAVTSYGYTSNCRYLGGYQRVDIPVVQDWLATFGVRP
jgi:hypothetical protein